MKLISKKNFLILIFVVTSCIYASDKNDSTVTIRISVVGDLMCHSPQFEYARIDKDSFDFNPVYREVRKYFYESDFVFGNLETVTAGKQKGFTGYPRFNSPDEFIIALKNSGFDLLTISNNHSLDRGEAGLLRTIEVLNKNRLHYNGTFSSLADRDSIRVIDIKGIKVAFLAYTYGTNGIPVPKGKSYLINLINFDLIKSDIENAKKTDADIVLVHYHFGEEYKREPNTYQKEVVQKTISFGADIIIGGHPHVLQPVQFVDSYSKHNLKGLNKKPSPLERVWERPVFAAYSLGNFISNQRDRYKDAGVILNLEITKNFSVDSVYISNVDYIPTWVFKGETNTGNEFIILPLHNFNELRGFKNPGGLAGNQTSLPEFLSETDIKKMLQAFNDTNEIMTKYTNQVKLYKEKPLLVKEIKPRGFDIKSAIWKLRKGE